jgi:hypothetical protein
MEKKSVYENVPGQGKVLDDGTWWTNCTVVVGEIHKSFMIPGKYTRVCKVVEVAIFDGKRFARWEHLD